MHKAVRRTLVLAVLLALLSGSLSVAFAAGKATDIKGHWAENLIDKWISKGLVGVYPDNTFKPNQGITKIELLSLIDSVLRYTQGVKISYKDVPESSPNYAIVSKAAAAGLVPASSRFSFLPNAKLARQDACYLIAKAFNLTPTAADATAAEKVFTDYKTISVACRDVVSMMYAKGYINGKPKSRFAPRENLTRAEAVKILNLIVGELKDTKGTYTGDAKGNVMVNAPDVVLKNMTISGDLFLVQGIGDGTVTLEKVVVKGKTIVTGGGQDSIVLNNTSLSGGVVVIKQDGKIRIVAMGDSSIPDVELGSGARLQDDTNNGAVGFGTVEILQIAPGQTVTLAGDFDEVDIEAPGVGLQVTDSGKVGKMTVAEKAKGAAIQIDAGASVETLTLYASAAVTGTGGIRTADIRAAGVTIQQQPSTILIASGITATIGGQQQTSGGAPAGGTTGGDTGTGGGGSTGGGGGGTTTPGINPTSISASIDNGSVIQGSVSGATATLNFSGLADSARITAISIGGVPNGCTLTITQVTSPNLGTIVRTKTITSSLGNIPVASLLVASNPDVSIGSMRTMAGSSVTIYGTFSCSGYMSTGAALVLNLGTSGTANIPNEWVTVSVSGTTVTATIKAGKGGTALESIGVVTFLQSAIGELPASVQVGAAAYRAIGDEAAIKNDVCTATGKASWGLVTLDDLKGVALHFTRAGDSSTDYTVIVN